MHLKLANHHHGDDGQNTGFGVKSTTFVLSLWTEYNFMTETPWLDRIALTLKG